MARNRMDSWGRIQRETTREGRQANRVRRSSLRLLCAGLIFAVCWLGLRCVPGARERFAPVLENLLTCSCDFEEAVRCFSAGMEEEGDMGAALEAFCVTAFAAQTGTADTRTDPGQLALRASLRCPEPLSHSF